MLRKRILGKKKYRVVGIFWGKMEKSGRKRCFIRGKKAKIEFQTAASIQQE
jgi:hypothetical protein